MSDHTDTTLTDLAEAILRWHSAEPLNASAWDCPCDGLTRTPDEHRQHVARIIIERLVAAARADERARWVTRLDALATEYEERASHLRRYGVHSNRIADLREAAARKLRALIEGDDH